MRQPIDTLPETMAAPGVSLRSAVWGGMTCNYNQFAAGIDFTPLLKGLPDDLCPCPHWGYVLKGRIRVRYADREEVLVAGDLFYLPPGHAPLAEEDAEFVEFSRPAEHQPVLDHVARAAAGA